MEWAVLREGEVTSGGLSVSSAQAESLRRDIPPSSQVPRLISAALCETKAYPLVLLHFILPAYPNHPLMPSDLRQGGATIPARLVRYLFTVVIMPGRSPNTEYRSFGTATRVSALSPWSGTYVVPSFPSPALSYVYNPSVAPLLLQYNIAYIR